MAYRVGRPGHGRPPSLPAGRLPYTRCPVGQTPISAALQRTLRLHDGMAGAERSFRAESGTATVSACGPLLAGPQHVGNLRQYVVLDVLRRVLAAAGYEVADAMLLTDVWRPRAGRNAPASDAAAGKFREMFAADLEDLGVRLPQHLGDVPNQIGDHLALIARLEALGLTYRTADGLYYDTSLWPGYGRLSPMPAGKADRPVARDGKRQIGRAHV